MQVTLWGAVAARPCRHGDRMKQKALISLIENGTCTAVMGLILITFLSSPVNAQQPPRKGCVTVSKSEYSSAKCLSDELLNHMNHL
jgi:hypothetical protein